MLLLNRSSAVRRFRLTLHIAMQTGLYHHLTLYSRFHGNDLKFETLGV